MRIFEWIIVVFLTIQCIVWIVGIRRYSLAGKGVMNQTCTIGMLWTILLALTFAMDFSPLHLIWLIPIAWLIGTYSIIFPLSLLWIPAHWYALLCTIGLDKKVASTNRAKYLSNIEKLANESTE